MMVDEMYSKDVVMIFHADFSELHLRLINTIYHENTENTYLLPYTEALT
jgi:hypothetical protein